MVVQIQTNILGSFLHVKDTLLAIKTINSPDGADSSLNKPTTTTTNTRYKL